MKNIAKLILFINLFFLNQAFSQDTALQDLIHGKKFFWEAKFDKAFTSLRNVTTITTARKDYLFEAYLYIGFVLIRQNAPLTEVRNVFKQAISIDPERDLDKSIIPPDLASPFNEIKQQMVGCLHIKSVPDKINVMGVAGDSILFESTTPFSICDLVTHDYELLFTTEGYEQKLMPLNLIPGNKDTLLVQLSSIYAKKTKRRGLKWAIGGGVLATAGAIVYKTVLAGDDDGGGVIEVILPAPPPRAEIGN